MDAGGDRTLDERLNEMVQKSWGYDQDSDAFAPPTCETCGGPVSMAGGRLHHEMPRNATWAALAYLAGRTSHEPKIA